MGLDERNVNTMLDNAIQNYLQSNPDYVDLRAHCLAMKPIQSIVNEVESELQAIAGVDKNKATDDLTKQMHQQQIDEDTSQAQIERTTHLKNQRNAKELRSKISGLDQELTRVNITYAIQHGLYLAFQTNQIGPLERRVQDLEARLRGSSNTHHQHNDSTVHTHGHGHGHAQAQNHHAHEQHPLELERELNLSRSRLRELRENERRDHALYFQSQRDIEQLKYDIANCNERLERLNQEQDQLTANQAERQQRTSARNNTPTLTRAALSPKNARQLDANIQSAHARTNSVCDRMKKTAKDTCYVAFINQLDACINGFSNRLSVSQNQQDALSQIIIKMKEHQQDLITKEGHEYTLRQQHESINLKNRQLAYSKEQFSQLFTRNTFLVNENEHLNTQYITFEREHNTLVKQGKLFGIYSLISLGVSGIGALSGYFLLQAGVIALIPGVNIGLAAVATAAILALAITASVKAIQASFKHSEKENCEQTIRNNEAEIQRNNQTMNQSQENDLPRLNQEIQILGTRIEEQTQITQTAQNKARASLNEAYAIGNRLSPSASYDPQNSFFPSAPPVATRFVSNFNNIDPVIAEAVVIEDEVVSNPSNKH